VAIGKNQTRNKIIVIIIVAAVVLGGFASLFSVLSRPSAPEAVPATQSATPEASTAPSEEPVEESAGPAAGGAPTVGTVVSGPIALTEADLALATSATAPLIAVGGTYISLQGYELFDTLTVLRFESGEQAYFATSGGPFPSGGGIPADQMSRELTGFGADLAADSAEAIEAAQILENHRILVG